MMDDFKIFKYPLMIKEHHLDTFAHVNNATYLSLLEEARWEFLTERGFDLKTIQTHQEGPIVLECHIKFLRELKLRQAIVIESQVISYDKKIGVMQQNIVDEHGMVYSQASLTFGFFDMQARRLISPSKQWLLAIGG
jgi:YbgC/YbaW family acyl-CoA thioester hydrolase